ncbi:aminodeoxychorismate synthase component I [Hathewaya histolytica]|uniref:aminodeoxychorismate synthase component I n=1 Tax=Hathewaya histolytica TaxID=1498 RepID=UPI003B67DFC4
MLLKEITTSHTLYEIYSIFKEEEGSAFLDSSLQDSSLSEYSFIGLNPFIKIIGKKDTILVNNEESKEDIFTLLKNITKKYKINNETELPFLSGGIGYFSYDFGRTLEKFESTAIEDVEVPLFMFNFYDNIIISDHKNKKMYISALGVLKEEEESIENICKVIKNYNIEDFSVNINYDYNLKEFESNFLQDEYIKTVEKVRAYIEEGDIYITNLTQRFSKKVEDHPYEIYRKLRKLSPAPFSAYLNYEDFKIISSSPERFIRIKDRFIETRPIKGTRPRGRDRAEDDKNKLELMNSEKDKSELLMIVDLERNDLSKICKEKSIKVTQLFDIEEYSTVFHLVSTIKGEIKEDKDAVDCINATFPGGSITGAPKIRSMEIIEELEGIKRNIYTGSIGYIGFDGNADFNIVIRTILHKDNVAYFGVGGGITYESDKDFEFEETLHKAKAIMQALS